MHDTAGNKGYDPYSFSLVLNGMNYYLNPLTTSGRYGTFKAIGSPDLFIEYVSDDNAANNTDNVSGEFWRVRTPDGATYTFGRTAGAEQVIWPMDTLAGRNGEQLRNQTYAPYNWKLDSITDVHGNRVEYVYESACGFWFDASGNRGPGQNPTQDECTEVDTAVSEVRYNFNGATAQTKVQFTNQLMNDNQRRQEKSMTAGVFRPTQVVVKHNDVVISRYNFSYTPTGAHYVAAWDVATEFWMLAGIQRFGSDNATPLPAQTFTYDREVSNGCYEGDCVGLLTEVANGYGAVTTLSYANWNDSRWQTVTQTETWDGVAYKKGVQAQGQTRTVYSHPGATACFDTAGSACAMGTAQPSEALVGFDKVTIETKAPAGGSNWTVVARSEIDFINANYLLLGKTDEQRRLNPAGGALLSKDDYSWTVATSANGVFQDDQLTSETHTLYDGANTLGTTTGYTYHPLDPPGGNYGALKTKLEQDETGAAVRCTDYAYAHLTTGSNWLVNRPIRETVKTPDCAGTKQAETLYRYAGSADPQQTAVDGRALLTYVLTWDGTNYVQEKRAYTANGLPAKRYTYVSTSTTTSYATDIRSTTTTTYVPGTIGAPSQIQTVATGAATETETFDYDPTFPWRVVKTTDSNGIFTQYGYDLFGRLTKVALPGDTLSPPTITYTYFDNGSNVLLSPLVVNVGYKNTIRNDERSFYDGLGRLVQTQAAKAEVEGAGDRDLITTIAYDARGLEACRTTPYAVTPYAYAPGVSPYKATACASQPRTTTTYDTLGRPTSVTGPDGAAVTTSYGVATTITVNGHSRLARTTTTDANGHIVNRFADAFGRLVLVREFTGAGAGATAYADTRYAYDALDRLTSVGTSLASNGPVGSFPRLATMVYDPLGRKTSMTDSDMGAWSYQYDPAGNLVRQEDSAGNVICFLYSKVDRLLKRFEDGNPGAACPAAPAAGDTVLAVYAYGNSTTNHNIGKVVDVDWGPGLAYGDAFTYDGEGRLNTQTRTIDAYSFAYTVNAYDLLDRPTSVTLPNGEVVLTTYDHEGENTLTAGGTVLTDTVGYTALGQLAFLGRKETAVGTVVPDTTLSYHPQTDNYRLSAITNSGSASFPDFSYSSYDAVGNLTGFSISGSAYTYTYDELNRLATVRGTIGRDYHYNSLSDFNSVTKGSVEWDYGYDALHPTRLATITTPTMAPIASLGYDDRGNLTSYTKSGTTTTYTFDVENRLTGVSGTVNASFGYDADGQRVKAVYGSTTVYTPFPDYEATDTGSNGSIEEVRITYRLAGQIVALRANTGAGNYLYYPLTDHLGNVTALSDVNGVFQPGSAARYDPFGSFTSAPTTNPSVTDHGFTGHRHNNTGAYDLGLIYMNARYYLPEVGRFISPDTIVPDPQNPQSYNRYSYVLNSPVNYTDPTGHKECSDNCPPDPQYWNSGADSSWHGSYDPVSQQKYQHGAESVKNVMVVTTKTIVGLVSEPLDWVLAFSDGFQWHDMIGMLPVIPAAAGHYGDDAIGLLKHADDYGILPNNELRKLTKGTGLEAHHIVEKRFAKRLEANADEMLSVALSPEDHQLFTNAWRNAIGYKHSGRAVNTISATVDNIWEAAQKAYADFPTLLDAARQTIFGR